MRLGEVEKKGKVGKIVVVILNVLLLAGLLWSMTSLSLLQRQVKDLENRLSLEINEKQRLQNQESQLREQITLLQNENFLLKEQISRLENRIDRILDITVKQFYEWSIPSESFWGRLFGIKETFRWELNIPLRLYVYYLEKTRPSNWAEWVYMAKDLGDREFIRSLIREINNVAYRYRFSEIRKIEFVIAFIQSLPYVPDQASTPWNEYPRYPIETLFDRGGDCEDTSILAAAILREMGYDVALIFLENEQHVAVGIYVPGATGSYYEAGGKKYFYLETTGEGWPIGQIPPDIQDTRAYVFPVP